MGGDEILVDIVTVGEIAGISNANFHHVIINRAFIPDLHRKKERKEREPSVTIRLPIILLSWKIIPSYRFDSAEKNHPRHPKMHSTLQDRQRIVSRGRTWVS